MLVYAEVLPTSLGRVMYRINKALKQYAPEWVKFTSNKDEADLQILDVIGKGSLEFLYVDNYVLMQHCFLSSDDSSRDFWLPHISKAKMMTSYMNLPSLVGDNSFNFHRMPIGVDPNTFFRTDAEKVNLVLTTGYVASTESIAEVYDAVRSVSSDMIHVGGNLNLGIGSRHYENISDESLNSLYNKSYYVSGLRKMEGFEAPIIEGLLCGTRGICYNKEHYSYWFGDLVEYVEEDDYAMIGLYSEKTKEQVESIFKSEYRPVTDKEIQLVKDKFSWEVIMKDFWKELENAL
jgi:hypothetical protein